MKHRPLAGNRIYSVINKQTQRADWVVYERRKSYAIYNRMGEKVAEVPFETLNDPRPRAIALCIANALSESKEFSW